MTINVVIPTVDFVYTGPDDYPYTYTVFDEEDLLVRHTDAAGLVTTLVLNTDYTVTLNGDLVGGTISSTYAPTSGTLTIVRKVTQNQLVDWVNNDPFDMETLERSFDKLTMIAQEQELTLSDILSKSLFRGVWIPDTSYLIGQLVTVNDLIENGNYYISLDTHNSNSGAFSVDKAAHWTLFLDLSVVTGSVAAAAASAAAALASESAAAASETASAVSEAAAAASELAAASSETAAAASATASGASEIAAGASETAAGLSETNAATSETAAGASEVAAAASETAAGLSETAATNSETAAAASEAAAGASETAAAASANLAEDWASEAEDVEVAGGLFSALHYAAKAAATLPNTPKARETATNPAGGNFTWNHDNGRYGFSVTSNAAILTLGAPTNLPTLSSGDYIETFVTIHMTLGSASDVAWNAIFKNTPDLAGSAARTYHLAIMYDGTDMICGSPVEL